MSRALEELVERGDLDELVREVDRLVDAGRWDSLVELRDRSRRALERGRQLWPAAALAEYQLARAAPGPWAARVVAEGAGRFTLGPLPEVAASTHQWNELAEHLPDGPLRSVTAHERVVRGDDLRHDPTIDRRVIELPLVLEPWETAYTVAEYHADRLDAPAPPAPRLVEVALPTAAPEWTSDTDECTALRDLAATWAVESNGRVEVVGVRGTAPRAVATLGIRSARMAEVEPAVALAHMAWAAASGGAHGRRRGMAAGRFGAWWAAAAVGGVEVDDPGSVGDAIAELRWHLWDAADPATGWSLRLAVEDPYDGVAWALAATDAA